MIADGPVRLAHVEALLYAALTRMDLLAAFLTTEDIAVRDRMRDYFREDES